MKSYRAKIKVPKGAEIRNMGSRGRFSAGRTYVVEALVNEYSEDMKEVRWAGSGSCWNYAKLDDVEVLEVLEVRD